MRSKGIIATAIAALMITCSPREVVRQDVTDLKSYFETELPADKPGGAVLIMKGRSVVFSGGFGVADVESREPITTKTLFNLGSISKTFVSNAILILESQGKLSVNDSLLKYFTEFKNKSIAARVRINHLLTHTSGLPDIRRVSRDTAFYLTAKDYENWYPVTQTDSLIFEPGSSYQYSNPAYNALALIVEKVSGMAWQQFVAENIFKPAGMLTSTITNGPHPESGVSHGYVESAGTFIEDDYGEEPTFAAAGNGGVWSSVDELASYEIAIQDAVFLSKEKVDESRQVKTFENWNTPTEPFIGWSWFIGSTADSLRTVGHTGSQGGFLCTYVTIPDKEIFFVILCNRPANVRAMSQRITEWLRERNWLDENQSL